MAIRREGDVTEIRRAGYDNLTESQKEGIAKSINTDLRDNQQTVGQPAPKVDKEINPAVMPPGEEAAGFGMFPGLVG
jgi:hypothetical protein